MISAVFDCVIYLQAAVSNRGPAYECLLLAQTKEIQLIVSPTILDEVRDVLNRPKIRSKFRKLTPERINEYMKKLTSVAELRMDAPNAGIVLRDPNDLPYLDLTIFAKCTYLVTRDKDLLGLMNDASFRTAHPSVQIVNPVYFINAVKNSKILGSSDTPEA